MHLLQEVLPLASTVVHNIVGVRLGCLLSESFDVDLGSTSERLATSPTRLAKDIRSNQAELIDEI